MPGNRDEHGKFAKGKSGNPSGRPGIPTELRKRGQKAFENLAVIADDPSTPVKVRADIEKWFAEMILGKPRQQVDMDAKMETGAVTVKFEGELDDWSK